MGIILVSEMDLLLDHIGTQRDDRLVALLHAEPSALAPSLTAHVDDALVVDVESPRLSRVNFDAIGLVILELTPDQLLSSAGRRLVDVLGRLGEESLDLAFVGAATSACGAFLQDGTTAGLNLIPACVVIDDVRTVDDLHGLLEQISHLGMRLLALDRPVLARYSVRDDTVAVSGAGNVMLVAFIETRAGGRKARAQILHRQMRRSWPT